MKRNGFISYSHKWDAELAEALQRGLHELARPWTRRPVLSVFRDTTSLSANHDLWASILTELEQSEFFIYLASPAAAASPWVCKEIDFWLNNRPLDRFLIVVSDGAVAWDDAAGDFDWSLENNALPPLLRNRFAAPPLWVNMVHVRESRKYSLRQADFRDAVASLAARLHGCTKDELDSRDIRERRLATRLRRAAISGLAALLVTSLGAGGFAWQQRNEALDRARTSTSQALAARSLELADTDPRKAAQFALYAEQVKPTSDSARALARAVEANAGVVRHFTGGAEELRDFQGAGTAAQSHVTLSRDGRILAYYSDMGDRKVHLYDTETDRELAPIDPGSLAQDSKPPLLSADGRTAALELAYNVIEIWDVRSGKRRQTIKAGQGEELSHATQRLRSFVLSGDGRWVAATYYVPGAPERDRLTLGVWNASTGKRLYEGAASVAAGTTTGDLVQLAFQDSGGDAPRLLVVDVAARTTRVFTPATRRWSGGAGLPGLQSTDTVLVSAPGNARRALLTSFKGAAATSELWDLVAGKRLVTSPTGPSYVSAVAADEPDVVVGSRGSSVVLYDATLRPVRTLGAFTLGVMSVAVSGDGRWVAAASSDGAVSLISAGERPRVSASAAGTRQLQFSADGRLAYERLKDKRHTDVWAVTDDEGGLRRIGRIPRFVGSLAAAPDGTRIAVATNDGKALLLWEPAENRLVERPVGIESVDSLWDSDMFFLRDGVHLAVCVDGRILVIDFRTGAVTQTLTVDNGADHLALSREGTTLAGASVTGNFTVWRWSAEHARFEHAASGEAAGTAQMLHGVAVSPAGEKVAVVDTDSRITFLDVAGGHTATSAIGPGRGLADVIFSADARVLLQPRGIGEDSGADFWDTTTGDSVGSWNFAEQGRADPALGVEVARTPDGWILTLGRDGSAVRRPFGAGHWRARLCALVAEPLPDADRNRYLADLEVTAPCAAAAP